MPHHACSLLAAMALLVEGCDRSPTSGAEATDASSTSPIETRDSSVTVAEAGSPSPRPAFAAKATGSFDGITWKPTFATVSIYDGAATIAIWDMSTPTCIIGPGDADLQFLVRVPYEVGKPTQLAKLKRPNPQAKEPAAFLGEVSLMSNARKNLATSYSGTVEITATPRETQALAHVKVDLRANGVTLRGEMDAIVCLAE